MGNDTTLPDANTQQTSAAQALAERWANTVLNVCDRHRIAGLVHTSWNGSARVDVECANLAEAYDLAGLLAGTDWIGVIRDSSPLGDTTTLVINSTPVVVRWASSLSSIPYTRGGRPDDPHSAAPTTIQPTAAVV